MIDLTGFAHTPFARRPDADVETLMAEVAAEALALALPLYPRAPGVDFTQALHAEDGVAPLSDQDVKPFSALQGLAEQLKAKDKSGSDDDK